MRKTFVLALVALSVSLVLASCDIIPGLGGEKPEYDADGRELVTLNVNVGGTVGGRSLSDTMAKGNTFGADYVEVIFTDGTKYYYKGGLRNSELRVRIPTGSYPVTNAIVLIGRIDSGDNTLLATGVISKVEYTDTTPDNTATPFVITKFTKSVTFSVKSLVADLTTEGGAFEIADGAGSAVANANIDFKDSTNKGHATIGSDEYDVFQVPTKANNIAATLTITGFEDTGAMIKRNGGDQTVTGSELVKFLPVGSVTTSIIKGVALAPSFPANNAAIGTSGQTSCNFAFTFTTDDPTDSAYEDGFGDPTLPSPFLGLYQISFKIPVVGFANTIPGQKTWYIRGGTKLGDPDLEGDESADVVLVVVDNPTDEGTLIELPSGW